MTKKEALRGIYQRGRIYWLTFQRKHIRRSVSLQTSDLSLAVRRAAAIKRGGMVKQNTGTLSRHLQWFLAHKQETGSYSRKSIDWAASAIRIFIRFAGDVAPDNVSFEIGGKWYADLKTRLSDSAAQSYMRAVRSFFSWLVQQRVAYENPITSFKLPRIAQPARLRFCDDTLRDRLIDNATDESLAFILYAGFHAGLRKNEIIEARPEWFDLSAPDNGVLHVINTHTFTTKGRASRFIPLTKEFRTFIERYGLRSPFMLEPTVIQGASLYRYDFRRHFEGYMRRQGFPWVTVHVMRHTFASLLVSRGVSLFKVAKWLGNTTAVTERHYAHLIVADPDIERGHRNLKKPAREGRYGSSRSQRHLRAR